MLKNTEDILVFLSSLAVCLSLIPKHLCGIERLHSTLGYRAPKGFEETWEKQKIEQVYVLSV